MTRYTIRGDTLAAHAAAPAGAGKDGLRPAQELAAGRLSTAQRAAIWKALPG
jgi:hypothetical protein